MQKTITFTKLNTAELLTYDIPLTVPGRVRVRTQVSTISCGTEKANITDSLGGSATRNSKAKFPYVIGYSSAGIVDEVGEGVTSVKPGDRVAMFWSHHQTYNVLPENRVIKLPDSVSFETAAINYIACFPMAAIRKTRLEMGEPTLVMGLGILGQLAVKLARIAGGCPIVAADPRADRREEALRNGADYAFDPTDPDFAKKVKEVTGRGAAVAIEVTGVGAGLIGALDCMAKFGRVALLGCTRFSDFSIDYYEKVHSPGITLIGAHTNARPDVESHPGYFTAEDDMKALIRLEEAGRLELESMIHETHTPEECGEVYSRLVFDKAFPTVVQFDWRNCE